MGKRLNFKGYSGQDLIVAVTSDKDIIGFGERITYNTDRWLHFQVKDWPRIKEFIDNQLTVSANSKIGGKDNE